MQINSVVISGNLVNDPESRSTENAHPVANFIIANNWTYRTINGEKRDEVSFIKIVVFGKHADACIKHLKKGALVVVDGRVAQDRWEDDLGKKHTKTKVIAKSVQFVGRQSADEEWA